MPLMEHKLSCTLQVLFIIINKYINLFTEVTSITKFLITIPLRIIVQLDWMKNLLNTTILSFPEVTLSETQKFHEKDYYESIFKNHMFICCCFNFD